MIVLITGYTSQELGIFNEKDIKVKYIKKVIRKDLINYLDNGVEWFVFTGKLGFEFWVLEVLLTLQEDYKFKIATFFCFLDHGANWSEINQNKIVKFKSVDFTKYFFDSFESVHQLRSFQKFCIEHTDEAYIFYDEEYKTNFDYFYMLMKEKKNYLITSIDFERLNESID